MAQNPFSDQKTVKANRVNNEQSCSVELNNFQFELT